MGHTISGTDTYQRSHSCNPHKGSCQGRSRPGPEGDLQQDSKVPQPWKQREAESQGGESRKTRQETQGPWQQQGVSTDLAHSSLPPPPDLPSSAPRGNTRHPPSPQREEYQGTDASTLPAARTEGTACPGPTQTPLARPGSPSGLGSSAPAPGAYQGETLREKVPSRREDRKRGRGKKGRENERLILPRLSPLSEADKQYS